ncbi:MAG: hypothetical protein FJZ89_08165, partial [Chloroflexi bacterium]|nr:hypothetical protein [Chloroflexota bacterium]
MEIGTVKLIDIDQEMRGAYLDYAMSVITARALPDVRDGLKPVQRRILFAMDELGLRHTAAYKKSARIVGEVLGKYHPHGDVAVYDAMVRLAQDFTMRYQLVDGQGNFGCFTGDTRIKLLDGMERSFEELSRLKPDEVFYVYSVDSNGRIVVGEGHNARITRRHAQLLELTLDTGDTIRCTPDHRFMLRDGSYKEAQYLTPDDSLMPGYQSATYNHRVVAMRWLEERQDVYDIEVDEYHNFLLADGVFVHNSIDGDPAAAMRYTEARLHAVAEEMLVDIDKDTVDFADNFDATLKEPTVLPAKLPNLLVNGSAGIAVGMATNIPPHNLVEVADALTYLIDHPDATVEDLGEFILGPDFPTGGLIMGQEGIKTAYATGKGYLTLRARVHFEEARGERQNIIVTELPYQVNKAALLEKMAALVKDRRIEGIAEMRDESDREGMRIVIELKREAQARQVLNNLFKLTQMQTTFGVILLALVDGEPRVLTLKRLLQHYVDYRHLVITRRTKFELARARQRAHILQGLKIALDNLDAVIATIRQARDAEAAKSQLIKRFKLTEIQAQAILDLQLRRLAALERKKIEDELAETIKLIARLEDLLAHPKKIYGLIKEDLAELKAKYGDARRTRIREEAAEFTEEDLIPDEEVLVGVTERNYVKRYRPARRTAKPTESREADAERTLALANMHDSLLIFTNTGRACAVKCHEVPEADRAARGTPLSNLITLDSQEAVASILPVRDLATDAYFLLGTRQGEVKRLAAADFAGVRGGGVKAMELESGDAVVAAVAVQESDEVLFVTREGQAIRFAVSEVRASGRGSGGVRAIRLSQGGVVVGVDVARPNGDLLVVTTQGWAKRSPLADYPTQGRGGGGVVAAKISPKSGPLAGASVVYPGDEVTLVSVAGQVWRVPAEAVARKGRSTSPDSLASLDKSARIVVLLRVKGEGPPPEAAKEAAEPGSRGARVQRSRGAAKKGKAKEGKKTKDEGRKTKEKTKDEGRKTKDERPTAAVVPPPSVQPPVEAPPRRRTRVAAKETPVAAAKPSAAQASPAARPAPPSPRRRVPREEG